MKSVQQRLSALREAMKKHSVDAFVIPSADPHLSEYLPEHGRRAAIFPALPVRPALWW